MVALEEYTISFAETTHEDPWQHALMGFMDSGGEFNEVGNASQWLDYKQTSFTSPTCSENNKSEIAIM